MARPTTIYFDINDARVFKEKVEQSLKEQKGKAFSPKNTILNPGARSLDRILVGFPQYKHKGSWHIMLDNGLYHFAEIYFSKKDADTFYNKMNQSFTPALKQAFRICCFYTDALRLELQMIRIAGSSNMDRLIS
jgi:hypothetical protein